MRKLKITAATILVAVAALTLTGCGDVESGDERNLRLGKECAEAGGEWVRYADGWGSGQYCRFASDKESPK